MTLQPTEERSDERLERALGVARAARTADIRRDLGGALLLYRDARELLDGMGPTPLLANILRWQGSVHRDRGELDLAEALYTQSLEVAEASGSAAAQAAALNCLALGAQRRGRADEANRLYQSAARLAAEAGEFRLTGIIEQNLGLLSNVSGNLEEAERWYRASLRAFENAGDHEAAASVLDNLGTLLNHLGAPSRAEEALRKALEGARARGDRRMEGVLLTHCAESLIALRRWEEATDALEGALEIVLAGEEPTQAAEVLKLLGVLDRERGRPGEALRRLGEALGVATRTHDRLLAGDVLSERAETHLRHGDVEAALHDLEHALAAFVAEGATAETDRVRRRISALREPGEPG